MYFPAWYPAFCMSPSHSADSGLYSLNVLLLPPPDILLFQRFKKQCRSVVTDRFQPCDNDELAAEPLLADRTPSLVTTTANYLNWLGGIPQRGISATQVPCISPGGWEQFNLTASEKTGMRRFVLFTVSNTCVSSTFHSISACWRDWPHIKTRASPRWELLHSAAACGTWARSSPLSLGDGDRYQVKDGGCLDDGSEDPHKNHCWSPDASSVEKL